MFPGWTKLEAGPPAAEKAAAEARQKALGEGKTEEEAEKAAEAAAETARVEAIAKASLEAQTPEQTRVEMMAHNGSVIEVRKESGRWTVVPDSQYARRITLDTPMRIAGPAAGHDRLKTNYDPTGTKVFGTINNCAGGKTPWGTVLMAEENFHGYFGGGDPAAMPEAANYKRYGVAPANTVYAWHRSVDRFNLAKEPNEPNRYGWMVEYDPYDPNSEPVKRTALGRGKREGATSIVNKDGRVVFYSGDDERFEYLYRFVTEGRYDPDNLEANRDLLDRGTLSVAKFDEDKLTWLPLVFGQGKLTEENGFQSQADVLIETRRAADLRRRHADGPARGRAAQPGQRARLRHAHQQHPPQAGAGGRGQPARQQRARAGGRAGAAGRRGQADADHAADEFGWNMFLLGGNPETADAGAKYHAQTQAWLSSPDNCAFDSQGRLWISTDQGGAQAEERDPGRHVRLRRRGRRAGAAEVLLRLPGRGGDVRAGVHARRQDAVRGRAAPGRGGRLRLDLREADDALAGLQGGRAAAAVDRRHHQGRRRADRELERRRAAAVLLDAELSARVEPVRARRSGRARAPPGTPAAPPASAGPRRRRPGPGRTPPPRAAPAPAGPAPAGGRPRHGRGAARRAQGGGLAAVAALAVAAAALAVAAARAAVAGDAGAGGLGAVLGERRRHPGREHREQESGSARIGRCRAGMGPPRSMDGGPCPKAAGRRCCSGGGPPAGRRRPAIRPAHRHHGGRRKGLRRPSGARYGARAAALPGAWPRASAPRRRRPPRPRTEPTRRWAVAHQLDDAAVVLGEQRVDHLAAQVPERGQRAGLVRSTRRK